MPTYGEDWKWIVAIWLGMAFAAGAAIASFLWWII